MMKKSMILFLEMVSSRQLQFIITTFQDCTSFWYPATHGEIMYSIRFKMSVVLTNCTQIKELNEIIIWHNTFTKMPKKKTKLKLHWKLWERKVWVFIEGKVGRKKLKLY